MVSFFLTQQKCLDKIPPLEVLCFGYYGVF